MAQSTGTFDSYDAVGNREDLTDMIWDVSPSDTPFLSAIKKSKARGTLHEWQEDSLAQAGANKQEEGKTAVPAAAGATTRLSNYTQILAKHVVISGTQEAVNKAGRKSEEAYQTAKRMKEIKLDLEWAMMDGGGADGIGAAKDNGVGDDTRGMGSFQTYITSNFDGAGSAPTGNSVDTITGGANRNFTETILTTVLGECFDSGADPKLMFVSGTNKGVVSAFDGGGTHYVDKDDKKLVNSVDIYVGDFHTLSVVPSRQIPGANVYLVDPEYVAYAELRPITKSSLATEGDSSRSQIIMEGTLEVCTEAAHGVIADTNG
jgi:hypothetical protein